MIKSPKGMFDLDMIFTFAADRNLQGSKWSNFGPAIGGL